MHKLGKEKKKNNCWLYQPRFHNIELQKKSQGGFEGAQTDMVLHEEEDG